MALAANNKYLVFPIEIQVLNIVCKYIEKIVKEISDIETSETASLTPTLLGFSDSVFGYGTLGVGVQFGAASIRRSVEEHISNTQLLSTDVDPLALWKARPLSKFTIAAVQVLGVLDSSAPVERVFSQSGLVCTAKRTRMKPDLLSAIMRAKYNK